MSIDFRSWDVAALGQAWRSASPFPHVVADDLLAPAALDELRAGLAREPHFPERGEIVDVMGSLPEVTQPALRRFAAALGGSEGLAAVRALTGKDVSRVELRSYVYLAGGYLLPHADYRPGVDRRIAFAYYLTHEGTCTGGELELFECALDGAGAIVATTPATLVAHRSNRLVLFDVSLTSLHQVREVTAGARASLAGWFL